MTDQTWLDEGSTPTSSTTDTQAPDTSWLDKQSDISQPKESNVLSDLGKSLKSGVQKLPGMVTGLADLPFAIAADVRPFTTAADAVGKATGFQPGKWAKDTKFSQGYEDSRKEVDAAWQDGGASDIAKAYISNPSYTLNQVVESLPSMVAGGAASKALMGVGRVAGVVGDAAVGVAEKAAAPGLLARTVGEKWAAPVAAGVGEGAVTTGQQMDDYTGEDQQKNALAALGAGVGTGLIGIGAGRLANHFGLETAETAMTKIGQRETVDAAESAAAKAAGNGGSDAPLSAKRRILGGMVSEGLLQELPQSAQEQMWQNYANDKPLMEGVTRAGVEGALAGAAMGAGANVHGKGNQPRTAEEIEQQVAQLPEHQQPAARAELNAELNAQPQSETGIDGLAGEKQGQSNAQPGNPDGESLQSTGTSPGVFQRPDPVRQAVQQAADAGGALSSAAGLAMDSGASPTYMPPVAAEQVAEEPQATPVVLQNRDRTTDASIAQMQEIAANPDYLRAGISRDMTNGAPVVFGDLPNTAMLGRPETVVDGRGGRVNTQYAIVDAGDVIASNNADGTTVAEYANGLPGKLRAVAGNGRTAGLQRAYEMGTAVNYSQELMQDSANLGIDPKAVAGMQRPVLVRVMNQADVTPDMGDRTNTTNTQKLSPVEQAGNDARRFSVANLSFDEQGSPTAQSINGFISAMPVAERGDMLNPNGTPTRQAVDRLMAATFKQAYNSDELVQLHAQATDPDARAVLSAAADASGVMAALSDSGEFDVRPAVTDAVKLAVNAARQGLKLSDVLQNTDFDMNPEAYPVATFLAQNIRSPKAMAEGLRRWGQLALQNARIAEENQRQGGLLGPAPTMTREEIFAHIGDAYNPTEQSVGPRQTEAQPQTQEQQGQIDAEAQAQPAPLPVPGNFSGTPSATMGTRTEAVAGPDFSPANLKEALAYHRARKQQEQAAQATPESAPDLTHLSALENRLSQERVRLEQATTEQERAHRTVLVQQATNEVAGERQFLGLEQQSSNQNLNDDELLAALNSEQAAQPTQEPVQAAAVAQQPTQVDAGKAWAAMPADERAAAVKTAGLNPVQVGTIGKADWGKINPGIQAQLSQAITAQNNRPTLAEKQAQTTAAPATPTAQTSTADATVVAPQQAAPTPQQNKAIERVNAGKAVFPSKPKADAFVADSGLADTHEVAQQGRAFRVQAKLAQVQQGNTEVTPALATYTPADIEAQQAQQEQAAKAEAARKRTETTAATEADDRKRIAQASVTAADTFELGQNPMDSLTGQKDVFADAAQEPEAGPTPDAATREKLMAIAKRLGVVVNTTNGGFQAGGGAVDIPAEDAQVEGALSANHVAAHELAHAAIDKRGISFKGHPIGKIKEFFVPNWDELVAASKAFRPAVWEHKDVRIKAHARKPNEVIADAIGSVYLGLSDVALLKPMMDGTGTTLLDLGLADSLAIATATAAQDQKPAPAQPTNPKEGIAKVRAEKQAKAEQQAEAPKTDATSDAPKSSRAAAAPDIRFSRTDTPAPPARGVSAKARMAMFNRLADSIAAHWANAPKIVMATNMDDPAIPESARQSDAKQRSNGARGHVEGFWHEGTAYILTDNLQSAADAVRVLLHESLGHHGLRGVFGPKLDAILSKVIELRRDDVLTKAKQYGLNPNDEEDLKEAAEEVLATMAQETPKLLLVRRAIAAIRSWLREHVPMMGSLALTDEEIIRSYILPARAFVERGGNTAEVGGANNAALSRAHGGVAFDESNATVIGTFKNDMSMKAHPDYKAAKGGDLVAAAALVQNLVKPEDLRSAHEKFGSDAVFIPVHAEEAAGRNQIPNALAMMYAANSGAEVDTSIAQANRAFHTGAGAMERLLARAEFSGYVEPGRRYVLVDDVTTMGSTLADLAAYIQRNGGEVAGSVVLVNAMRGGKIQADRKTINQLEARHGEVIRELFGFGPQQLTAAEAQYLIGFRSADELRTRVVTAKQARVDRLASKNIPQRPDSPGSDSRLSRSPRADTAPRVSEDSAAPSIRFSRAAAAIDASTGALNPDQKQADDRAFGLAKEPTLKEQFDSLRANFGLKARQALVDQFAAIKQLDPKAYMLARMSKASDGTLEAALLYGMPFLNDGVPDVKIGDGGFANVLASLNGEHYRFMKWVAALRAERLKSEGKENLMTDDDISALKTLNQGQMPDGRSRVLVYGNALSKLNAYNEAMLKMAMESGLIDQDTFDLMKDQPYVPFYRLMEDDKFQGPKSSSALINQKAWHKLKGGTNQLNADLLLNMMMNWSHLLQASARNRAALAAMDEAEKMAIAYQVPATAKGAVRVMRDGFAEHWMIEDPYLLEAVGALNYTTSPLMKPLSKMKQILTMAVTVNPTFKIRNLIRDSVSAIAQSELGYNPVANIASGWKLAASDSQIYASMLAGGGIIKFGTQENTDRLRQQIEKLGGQVLDKTGAQKLMGQVGALWDAYSEFGDRTENVNRVALYDKLMKQKRYHTADASGNTSTTDSKTAADEWLKQGRNVTETNAFTHAEANFMARDLMDFSMGGAMPLVRFLTQTVPFMNARLVGLDKLGRAAIADPRKFATMAAAVSIASVALMLIHGDDDDWKRRDDSDRDSYWWFKIGNAAFKIPKPFELGAIGTMAERTFELMFEKEMTNKRFRERIAHMFSQTFAFDPIPQAIKPLLDVYANKDSFTRKSIESPSDQRLRPQDRYSEHTSEVARMLGKMGLPEPSQLIKGDYVSLSPKQIDHLIKGYFSWVGVTAVAAADAVIRPALGKGERPDMRLKDMFMVGNFVETLPTGSSRYVTQMYEQARQINEAYASYREALKSGEIEKAQDIKAANMENFRNRLAFGHAQEALNNLNQQAKKIEASRTISGEEKRQRLTDIEQQRNTIAQRMSGRMAA